MKMYGGMEVYAVLIWHFKTRPLYDHGKKPPVPTEKEAG
jgi:hypothetical protein